MGDEERLRHADWLINNVEAFANNQRELRRELTDYFTLVDMDGGLRADGEADPFEWCEMPRIFYMPVCNFRCSNGRLLKENNLYNRSHVT
jgi:hypothetical protein